MEREREREQYMFPGNMFALIGDRAYRPKKWACLCCRTGGILSARGGVGHCEGEQEGSRERGPRMGQAEEKYSYRERRASHGAGTASWYPSAFLPHVTLISSSSRHQLLTTSLLSPSAL
jgi:hypothetical protein